MVGMTAKPMDIIRGKSKENGPNQYRRGGPSVKGLKECGLVVEVKRVYFEVLVEASFRENALLDGISPKKGKQRAWTT